MSSDVVQDEAVILEVRNWQTADKYAVCFCRDHGKVPFIAYGAAYPKSTSGRLVQPFAHVRLTLLPGRRVATLRNCEFVEMPESMDIESVAYGTVIAEVVTQLLGEDEPQEAVFDLLLQAFRLFRSHNKRLVTDSTILKLLSICGFEPLLDHCTTCGKPMEEDGYFSPVQGGFICKECSPDHDLPLTMEGKHLMEHLLTLDFSAPDSFVVRGKDLMEVEKIIYRFLLFQTDRPLRSLGFLSQLKEASL
jgi:DNA repair protein RecO (recombination protein O)